MTPTAALLALPKLPIGTLVHDDDTGRNGTIFDTGLSEDETRVYYLRAGDVEWKTAAAYVEQVQP